jgi:HAD superfamily hydrolase (TIGR01509 family)
MAIQALFFGSLETLCALRDVRRRYWNRAFAEAGLDWRWDEARIAELMPLDGWGARIAREASDRGVEDVDVAAVEAAGYAAFAEIVQHEGLTLRPGAGELLRAACGNAAIRIALCTTEEAVEVDTVLEAIEPAVTVDDLAWIGERARVARPKPHPHIYRAALAALSVAPERTLAVESSPEAARTARKLGLGVIGFPEPQAAGNDFPAGILVTDRLRPRLLELAAGAGG